MTTTHHRPGRRIAHLLGTAAIALGLLGGAFAVVELSDPPQACAQEPDRPREAAVVKKRRKMLERVQALRYWKLEEALELDEATLKKVDAELRRYDERLFAKQIEMHRASRKLKRAVREGASDAVYQRRVDAVLALKKEIDGLRLEQYEAAAGHLEPRDKARLLLFIPAFDKKVKQVMRKRRDRRMKGKRRRPGKRERGRRPGRGRPGGPF